jgi:integrase
MGVESLLERIAAAVGVTPVVSVVTQTTIRELCDLYKASPEFHGLADQVTERGRLKTIVRILGDRSAATLTLSDVDHLLTVRREEGMKPSTRNRELMRLCRMLRWSTDRGHIPSYPLPRIRQEPERNERSTYRSEEDIYAIVTAAKAKGRHVIAAIIATAYDSGLRRREVCKLRLEQADERDGVIAVPAPVTKAQRARVAPLSDWAAAMCRAIQRPDGCPWMFPTKRGRPYHPRVVTKYYQEACELAGIKAAPGEKNFFHDTRAGFADNQIAVGTHMQHVMEMAGWQDYRTARRYMRRAARKIAIDAKARLEEHRRAPKRANVNTRQESGSPVVKNTSRKDIDG